MFIIIAVVVDWGGERRQEVDEANESTGGEHYSLLLHSNTSLRSFADVLSKSDKNVDFNLLLEHLTPFLADGAKPVVTKLYKALSGERDSDGIPIALGGGTRSKKINIVGEKRSEATSCKKKSVIAREATS